MKVIFWYDEGFGLSVRPIKIIETFAQQDLKIAFYSSKKDLETLILHKKDLAFLYPKTLDNCCCSV